MSQVTRHKSPSDDPSHQITVYRPNQRHELGLIHTWTVMAQNVWKSRELIWQLFKRDFFAVYKKSFLGVGWIFIWPIVGVLNWIFLQLAGVLQPGDVGLPYPIYVLIGSSMWGLFTGNYYAASGTLNSGKDLIMQVNYPHEALLFKQLAQQLANFILTLCLNLLALFGLRIFRPEYFEIAFPSWGMLLFPVMMLPVLLLASAMGLFMAMVAVVAVDISKVINTGMGLLLYLTPVIYTAEKITNPLANSIIAWNPLTYLVCSCRDVLIYGTVYQGNWTAWACSSLLALVAFLVSWRLFYVSENKLVERMV